VISRRGFISAGNWTLDRIKRVDRWPEEESVASIVSLEREGGGCGHNFAVDIRRLDDSMPVEAIGLLGQDADGDHVFALAKAAGIVTTQLRRTKAVSSSFTDVVSVVNTGKRTFFHYAGTNDLLTPDQFEFSGSRARVLHLGLPGLHKKLDAAWQDDASGWVTILKNARAAGLKTNMELVSIEPERIKQFVEPCLPYLDFLIVNDHEIGGLAGVTTVVNGVADPEACCEAAQSVCARGTMEFVAVHYPGGAVCVTHDSAESVPSFRQAPENVLGSVGAGDAFAAGMLYAWHEGWAQKQSLMLAHAVAAASLRSVTTVGSVESVDACLAFVGLCRVGEAGSENYLQSVG